jgi:hypothetical protein
MWDPANLALTNVTPAAVSSKDQDVTLTVSGVAFAPPATMRACFVNLDNPFDKRGIIPCNDIATLDENTATVRICPLNKRPGNYQLVWWLLPPPSVTEPTSGTEVGNVPVNDVQVLAYALMVAP